MNNNDTLELLNYILKSNNNNNIPSFIISLHDHQSKKIYTINTIISKISNLIEEYQRIDKDKLSQLLHISYQDLNKIFKIYQHKFNNIDIIDDIDIIHYKYKNNIINHINQQLQDIYYITFNEISNKYNLSLSYIKNYLLKQHFPTISINTNCLYHENYIKSIKKIINDLNNQYEPILLDKIMNKYHNVSTLGILKELKPNKLVADYDNLNGIFYSINHQYLYISNTYEQSISKELKDIYNTKQYITYNQLDQSYHLKKNLKKQHFCMDILKHGILLDEIYLHKQLIIKLNDTLNFIISLA